MIKMDVKDKEVLFDINTLKKDVRHDIIDYGLDERLASDVKKLKSQLLYYVKNLRETETSQSEPNKPEPSKPEPSKLELSAITTPPTINSNNVNKSVINTTKAEDELIKHFTGLDVNTIRKNKNFQDLVNHKVAFIRQDRNLLGNDPKPRKMTPGIQYRLDMSQYDTFESQYNKAIEYFNKTLYVLEKDGKTRLLVNPGNLDLSRFVKVVCSRDVGDTPSARERFQKYRETKSPGREKGYADWTLSKEGIEYIKQNFVDITDSTDKIQQGQIDEAINTIKAKSNNTTPTNKSANKLTDNLEDSVKSVTKSNTTNITSNTLAKIQEKIEDLKTGKNLSPSVEAYINIIKLIKNFRILKTMMYDGVRYSLVTSDGSSTEESDEEFLIRIKYLVTQWKIANHYKWFDTLLRKVYKLIHKYNSRK